MLWIDPSGDATEQNDKVPKNGSWNGFTINCPLNADGSNNAPNYNTWTANSIIGGSIWNSTWWPTTGVRHFFGLPSFGVGAEVDCWASSAYEPVPYYSYCLTFYYSGGIYPSSTAIRSLGLSVRCVQE